MNEVFTKNSWNNYKKHIEEYNNERTKDSPWDAIHMDLMRPTFEGYMNFCFPDTEEPSLKELTKDAFSELNEAKKDEN